MGALKFADACRDLLGVEPETVAGWFDQDESTEMFRQPPMRERAMSMFAAGIWLRRQLVDIGVSERDAEDACFAAGQMMAMDPDPWGVARRQLHTVVEEGVVVVPGPALAQALLEGRATAPARPRSPLEAT